MPQAESRHPDVETLLFMLCEMPCLRMGVLIGPPECCLCEGGGGGGVA